MLMVSTEPVYWQRAVKYKMCICHPSSGRSALVPILWMVYRVEGE